MNYKNIKSYIEAISPHVPQTLEELSHKLGRSPRSIRITFNYINSLATSKHPVLKFRKIGNKVGIIKSEVATYARLEANIKKKIRSVYIKPEKSLELQSFEIIEKYHKNKCCQKCKGRLELNRYYKCMKCKPHISFLQEECKLPEGYREG